MTNTVRNPIQEPAFNSILRNRREAFAVVPETRTLNTPRTLPAVTLKYSTHEFVILMPADLALKIATDVMQSSDFAISNIGDRKLVCFKETPASVNICMEVRFEQLPTGATRVIFCNFNFGMPTLHKALIQKNMLKLQRLMEKRCA